jgi:FkbM family methyltransferase
MQIVPFYDQASPAVHNNASVNTRGGRLLEVTVPSMPWAYAASFKCERQQHPAAVPAVVEVNLGKISGEIGIGILSSAGDRFLVERIVTSSDEFSAVRLALSVRDECGDLVIRNGSAVGAPGQIDVLRIVTKSAPVELTQRPKGELLSDQRAIIGRDARLIIDVGAHHGHSTVELLTAFPNARVIAFEAEAHNFAQAAAALRPYGPRVEVHHAAVSDRPGTLELNVNSHDGTHSLLRIGEQRYWGGFAEALSVIQVQSVTIDDFAAHLGTIDILKLDIQGAELRAFHGARRLLEAGRIRLIATEVAFYPLYENQALFWEIGAYLRQFGFNLYGLYDLAYHPKNSLVLSWADAIFLGPEFLKVQEWDR